MNEVNIINGLFEVLGPVGILVAMFVLFKKTYEAHKTEINKLHADAMASLEKQLENRDNTIARYNERLLEYQKVMLETSNAIHQSAINSEEQSKILITLSSKLDSFLVEIKALISSVKK